MAHADCSYFPFDLLQAIKILQPKYKLKIHEMTT